jgi:hypothetical protein
MVGLMMAATVAGCGDGATPEERPAAATAPAAAAPAQAPAPSGQACPLTVEQVAAVTGAPMTLTPGGCTFFPANGRDVPHVFYVLQVPMVCNSIQPADLGFTEPVAELPGRAFVRDQIDGSHVLVCGESNARAFDVVVDIRNDKPANRAAAIALAKQVLASR